MLSSPCGDKLQSRTLKYNTTSKSLSSPHGDKLQSGAPRVRPLAITRYRPLTGINCNGSVMDVSYDVTGLSSPHGDKLQCLDCATKLEALAVIVPSRG